MIVGGMGIALVSARVCLAVKKTSDRDGQAPDQVQHMRASASARAKRYGRNERLAALRPWKGGFRKPPETIEIRTKDDLMVCVRPARAGQRRMMCALPSEP